MTQKLRVVRTKIVLETYLTKGEEEYEAEKIRVSIALHMEEWAKWGASIVSVEVKKATVANR